MGVVEKKTVVTSNYDGTKYTAREQVDIEKTAANAAAAGASNVLIAMVIGAFHAPIIAIGIVLVIVGHFVVVSDVIALIGIALIVLGAYRIARK